MLPILASLAAIFDDMCSLGELILMMGPALESLFTQLPIELIHRVIDFIPHNETRLAPLAIVSRQWQSVVESILFRDIRLCTNQTSTFLEMFSGKSSYRRMYLRTLRLIVEVGGGNVITSLSLNRQFRDLGKQNNLDWFLSKCGQQLSTVLRAIWEGLRSWGEELDISSLYLGFQSLPLPEVWFGGAFTDVPERIPSIELSTYLPEGYVFPRLSSVRTLFAEVGGSMVSSYSLFDIITALPRLEDLNLKLHDNEKNSLESRMEIRRGFASRLRKINTQSSDIKVTEIRFNYTQILNDNFVPYNLLDHGVDHLSDSIRDFSQNLTELTVSDAPFSAEIFWPSKPTTRVPQWPHLKRYIVRTPVETAIGNYSLLGPDVELPHIRVEPPLEVEVPIYLEGMLAYNADLTDSYRIGLFPKYQFRIRPDHDNFTNLAIAIARATTNMPKLELLIYHINRGRDQIERFWGFSYEVGENNRPPRTDWAFCCPYEQLMGWAQPEEATTLWKNKCGDYLEESIITQDLNEDSKRVAVRRFKDGRTEQREQMGEHFHPRIYCIE